MIKLRGGGNPFYVLLVIAGVAFVVTACAYGVMAFRQANPLAPALAEDDASLMGMLDRHGALILLVQVVVLALLSICAMGTDKFWDRRAERRAAADAKDVTDANTATAASTVTA